MAESLESGLVAINKDGNSDLAALLGVLDNQIPGEKKFH
jgi:hypothetical protein